MYMYMYIYMHIHTYMYIFIYVCMYVCIASIGHPQKHVKMQKMQKHARANLAFYDITVQRMTKRSSLIHSSTILWVCGRYVKSCINDFDESLHGCSLPSMHTQFCNIHTYIHGQDTCQTQKQQCDWSNPLVQSPNACIHIHTCIKHTCQDSHHHSDLGHTHVN
jgi:hypothetical protein